MANTALRVAELDFDSIKENLKTYLRSQAEFTDYDFEGSGMSVLLDILAYNTHYMGYYLNMIGNEMFLDTSQLRSSAISHAKLINYVPESAKGAVAKVNILATPSDTEDQVTNTITLDKYTNFIAEDIDGTNYNFVTLYSNTVSKTSGSFSFANIVLKQGEVISRQFVMDNNTNTYRRFNIPSANVDLDTLKVTVRTSSTQTNSEEYIKINDITTSNGNTKVYFVEEDLDGSYVVYFGDNYIGKKPDNGSVITITYLDTSGSVANNLSNFINIDSIGGKYRNNVRITTALSSASGRDKETINQIKFRAPYFYTAQNRAVTKLDYEVLIAKQFNYVDAISVWGGEDEQEVGSSDEEILTAGPVYGKVFISIKPTQNYTLTNLDKENIKNYLIENTNVVTVIPEIIDPTFTYLNIVGNITYNPSLTNLTSEQILQIARNAVLDYSDNNLNTFNSSFRKSKLQRQIENSEPSITGTDIDVYVQRRILIDANQTKTYVVNFNMPLSKGTFTEKLYTFPTIRVKDSANIERSVFFEEVPNSFTGIDKIEIIDAGISYTSVPTVTITGDGQFAKAVATIRRGRVESIALTNPGINYTRAFVSITGGGTGSQASARAILQSRFGTLRTYYFKSNGEKVILNSNAGTIDYDTGKITISSLTSLGTTSNDFYDTNILTINALPQSEIISPLRNRILTIDENLATSIQLTMVSE